VDQALNLVTRVAYPSYASIASDLSADLDGMDAMDDLDVAADLATTHAFGLELPRAPRCGGWDPRR